MMTQETLIALPDSPQLPPEPPTPVVVAEPCVKCSQPATLLSPGGSVYCAEHGKCGGKSVEQTALGLNVKVCGRSVEKFVMHPRLGIWCCTCILKFEREQEK